MSTRVISLGSTLSPERLYCELLQQEAVSIATHIQNGTTERLSTSQKVVNTILGVIGVSCVGIVVTIGYFVLTYLQAFILGV